MLCEIVPALQDVVSAQPRRRWMFHMLRTSQECRGWRRKMSFPTWTCSAVVRPVPWVLHANINRQGPMDQLNSWFHSFFKIPAATRHIISHFGEESTELNIADVCLPKTSWKAVPQPWAGSRETSVPKVAVGPPHDTSPRIGTSNLVCVIRLVIKRSLVQLPAGALSSQLGQLSLPSLQGR